MPEGGLTTLTDVSLMETDRLLRDFVAIEEVHHRERELENIDVTTYDATKGETTADVIPALIRKYPNAYVVRDFSDTEAAKMLINEVRDEDRLVITTVHAKSAAEALLRMLQLKVPQREFASVVYGRSLHAADSQTVRCMQGGLRPDPRFAQKARHSRRAKSKPCIVSPSRKKSKSRAKNAAASASKAAPACSNC